MADPIATLTKKLADYMMTSSVPWPDEGAMRRAVSDVVRLMVTEAAPEALSLIHEVRDSIERDPDPIQSSHWQAEPPGEDGWYIMLVPFDAIAVHHVVQRSTGPRGKRLTSGWFGTVTDDFLEAGTSFGWRWLVPGIELPPLPEEEP